MFWVVSETVREQSVMKRMKLLKHFIKVARHCKDTKNFNSMFALVSGLGHQAVSRLRQTWDRLPTKYLKMFEVCGRLTAPFVSVQRRSATIHRSLFHYTHVTVIACRIYKT